MDDRFKSTFLRHHRHHHRRHRPTLTRWSIPLDECSTNSATLDRLRHDAATATATTYCDVTNPPQFTGKWSIVRRRVPPTARSHPLYGAIISSALWYVADDESPWAWCIRWCHLHPNNVIMVTWQVWAAERWLTVGYWTFQVSIPAKIRGADASRAASSCGLWKSELLFYFFRWYIVIVTYNKQWAFCNNNNTMKAIHNNISIE